MKKSELIKKLQEIPKDSVYKENIYEVKETTEKVTAYSGYCEEEENPNKIVMYVYP